MQWTRCCFDRLIGGDSTNQFGRALYALNIEIVFASSSQAKGRVERMNKTLQYCLVKRVAIGRP
jgi:hypothetical protein